MPGYLAEVGGASVAQRFKSGVAFDSFLNFEWRDLKPEERRERCAMKPVWWAGPTRNTRDLATSFFPNARLGRSRGCAPTRHRPPERRISICIYASAVSRETLALGALKSVDQTGGKDIRAKFGINVDTSS